jgi:hypothetical protein
MVAGTPKHQVSDAARFEAAQLQPSRPATLHLANKCRLSSPKAQRRSIGCCDVPSAVAALELL